MGLGGGGTIRGVVGLLKWGYYNAAAINGYTVTRSSQTGAWSLRATIVNLDAFKIRQRPLTFVAPHEKGQWVWPIVSFELGTDRAPTQMTAKLGPPEE